MHLLRLEEKTGPLSSNAKLDNWRKNEKTSDRNFTFVYGRAG
jgi:hypothetical protein